MQPQQPQYIPPVNQPQQPANFDFTQQQQPQQPQAPIAPVVPTPDPAFTQLQTDIAEIKQALGTQQPAPVVPNQQPQTGEPAKKYDEWGAVFDDVDKRAQAIVDAKFAEAEQQREQNTNAVNQQEQQNQQYIDNTVNQLRQAGYLPAVTNQFDANDQGKLAENELLGYAISLGSTDLVSAARELKFRHDAGFKYDYASKGFVQVNPPNTQDPNGQMFGNLPQTPDGQMPQQFAPQIQQPQFQQPVGPRNPYMQPQYPAGFNAPVSSGNSYQGTQNGVPNQRNIRSSSYDNLVAQFNATQ